MAALSALFFHRDQFLRRRLLAASDRQELLRTRQCYGRVDFRRALFGRVHFDGACRQPLGSQRRKTLACGAFGLCRLSWAGAKRLLSQEQFSPACFLLALSSPSGIWSTLGPFWSLPTAFLSGTAAAGGIALVNSVGNIGGFVGPYVIGYVKEATDAFTSGLLVLAATIPAT